MSCTIGGRPVVPDAWNWSRLWIAVFELFIGEGNPGLASLPHAPEFSGKRIFLSEPVPDRLCAPLSNSRWLYAHYNSQQVVAMLADLCRHCGVDLDDVEITYAPVGAGYVPAQQVPHRLRRTIQWDRTPGSTSREPRPAQHMATQGTEADFQAAYIADTPPLQDGLSDVLAGTLLAHFGNGFRIGSPVDSERFRRLALEDSGREIHLADEELSARLGALGTTFDGKVYPVSEATKERIGALAKEYFGGGADVIFYEELYEKNRGWLNEARVVSARMLAEVLKGLFPGLAFTQTYFGHAEGPINSVVGKEILRVWGDGVLATYDQLAERLAFVPLDRIREALSKNGDFIWSDLETYAHISKVGIDDADRAAVRDCVAAACRNKGYASFGEMPLGEIAERNGELSPGALHDAIHRLCLAQDFDRQNKIITPKGKRQDAQSIIEERCRKMDTCTLQRLLEMGEELTGQAHAHIPLKAAYATLVRIDEDNFVADRHVRFDACAIDAIDAAVGRLLAGDYLPLMSITTFGAFPDCGQNWTPFLLESHCRRFSRAFRFEALGLNSQNAGAIVRKSCKMNYTQIMADALAKSGVELEPGSANRFLTESGYIGKSATAKAGEIVHMARAIRAAGEGR